MEVSDREGGRGSRGGGRMRSRWNGVLSLLKALDCSRKAAKAGRERLASPSPVRIRAQRAFG